MVKKSFFAIARFSSIPRKNPPENPLILRENPPENPWKWAFKNWWPPWLCSTGHDSINGVSQKWGSEPPVNHQNEALHGQTHMKKWVTRRNKVRQWTTSETPKSEASKEILVCGKFLKFFRDATSRCERKILEIHMWRHNKENSWNSFAI